MLGAVLGWELTRRLAAAAQNIDVAAALRPETHRLLSPSQLRIVQEVLGHSLLGVFLLMFAMALLVIVCSVGLKGGRADSPGEEDQQPGREHERIGLTVGLETLKRG